MSPLEDALQQRQELQNKGYTDDQIQSAALMLIAERLFIITTPFVTVKDAKDDQLPTGDDHGTD